MKAGFLGPAEVLLDRGPDPNAPSDDKETALFYAFKRGKRADVAAMCRGLIEGGTDPSIPDRKGRTLIEAAKRLR